jgi:hypothetical protein
MDIYSTHMLARTVESLKRPQRFFLDKFFGLIETSDSETIHFDVEAAGEKRRLTPYVHPLVGGKIVESAGYSTKTFSPAYVKDKRVHDPSRAFKRVAGETIGTGSNVTPAQRFELALQRDLKDQLSMLTRRFEYQAVEALKNGTVVVKMLGQDGTSQTVTVNFGRDSALQITKAAGARWSVDGVKPMEDLEDWSMSVLQKSGSSVRTIIMDPAAWRQFRKSGDLEKRLDLKRVLSGELNLGQLPDHVQYKGNDGTFDYWVYSEWYWDVDTSAEVALLDSGRVIGVGDVLGVRHFGAIKDSKANFQAMEYFTKSWEENDPPVRMLLMQSAPLMVPYRINASFSAKVLA